MLYCDYRAPIALMCPRPLINERPTLVPSDHKRPQPPSIWCTVLTCDCDRQMQCRGHGGGVSGGACPASPAPSDPHSAHSTAHTTVHLCYHNKEIKIIARTSWEETASRQMLCGMPSGQVEVFALSLHYLHTNLTRKWKLIMIVH